MSYIRKDPYSVESQGCKISEGSRKFFYSFKRRLVKCVDAISEVCTHFPVSPLIVHRRNNISAIETSLRGYTRNLITVFVRRIRSVDICRISAWIKQHFTYFKGFEIYCDVYTTESDTAFQLCYALAVFKYQTFIYDFFNDALRSSLYILSMVMMISK